LTPTPAGSQRAEAPGGPGLGRCHHGGGDGANFSPDAAGKVEPVRLDREVEGEHVILHFSRRGSWSAQVVTIEASAPEFSLINGGEGGSTLEPCIYDAGKKIVGRKRHLLTSTIGMLLAVFVHPTNVHDRDGAEPLLDQARIAQEIGRRVNC